jgi:hypothetical protein
MGNFCETIAMDEDDASTPLVMSGSKEDDHAAGPFYNAESVLDMPKSLAEGYFVLVTGGRMVVPDTPGRSKFSNKKKRNKKSYKAQDIEELTTGDDGTTSLDGSIDLPDDLSISWMSILDGNVIDSCFGVTANGGARFTSMLKSGKRSSSATHIIQDADKHSVKKIKVAKAQLTESAETHLAIKLLSIEAYGKCMRTVIEYHNKINKYGIFSPIFCYRNRLIRDNSLATIHEAFEHLTGAVEATL